MSTLTTALGRAYDSPNIPHHFRDFSIFIGSCATAVSAVLEEGTSLAASVNVLSLAVVLIFESIQSRDRFASGLLRLHFSNARRVVVPPRVTENPRGSSRVDPAAVVTTIASPTRATVSSLGFFPFIQGTISVVKAPVPRTRRMY